MADILIAIALAAGSQLAADAAVTGLWATGEDGGRVRIEACPGDPAKICGALVDAQVLEAFPDQRDVNNPDEALRDRPLRGVAVIEDFERGAQGAWTPGLLYDPEEGRRIERGHIKLLDPGRLEVRGCVAVFCRTQVWTRVESGD